MDAGGVRERIMGAAARLLAESGAEGTSTRAICEAAGVTQPTLYHHFGDKAGLIEAVVAEAFERSLARKRASEHETDDPVEDLRHGWDKHVAFGVANPHLYAVMHGLRGAGRPLKAAEEASSMLLALTRRIARAGRLRVEPELAANIVWAAVHGVTSLLSSRLDFGWPGVLNATVCEAVISAITLPARQGDPPWHAEDSGTVGVAALRLLASLEIEGDEGDPAGVPRGLSEAETAMLKEWLGRLARDVTQDAPRTLGVRLGEANEDNEERL